MNLPTAAALPNNEIAPAATRSSPVRPARRKRKRVESPNKNATKLLRPTPPSEEEASFIPLIPVQASESEISKPSSLLEIPPTELEPASTSIFPEFTAAPATAVEGEVEEAREEKPAEIANLTDREGELRAMEDSDVVAQTENLPELRKPTEEGEDAVIQRRLHDALAELDNERNQRQDFPREMRGMAAAQAELEGKLRDVSSGTFFFYCLALLVLTCFSS